jgi:Tfp pilus assembly protein PilE
LVDIQAKLDAADKRIDSFYDHVSVVVGLIGIIAALVVVISYNIIRRNANSEVNAAIDAAIKTVDVRLKQQEDKFKTRVEGYDNELQERIKKFDIRVKEFDIQFVERLRKQTESSLQATGGPEDDVPKMNTAPVKEPPSSGSWMSKLVGRIFKK